MLNPWLYITTCLRLKEERKHTVVIYILVVVGALLLAVLGLILALAILLVGHRGALGVNLLLGGILRRKCKVVNQRIMINR